MQSQSTLENEADVKLELSTRHGGISERSAAQLIYLKQFIHWLTSLQYQAKIFSSFLFVFILLSLTGVLLKFPLNSSLNSQTEQGSSSFQAMSTLWTWCHITFIKSYQVKIVSDILQMNTQKHRASTNWQKSSSQLMVMLEFLPRFICCVHFVIIIFL